MLAVVETCPLRPVLEARDLVVVAVAVVHPEEMHPYPQTLHQSLAVVEVSRADGASTHQQHHLGSGDQMNEKWER